MTREEETLVQWYLLKTWAGREEELVQEIRRTVPGHMYKECFVIYQERIWRKQQKSIVHVEPLFPGCVFLTCESCGLSLKDSCMQYGSNKETLKDSCMPSCNVEESRRQKAEQVAAEAEGILWGRRWNFLPLMQEDARFLEELSGRDHRVKLSYVQKDEEGKISRLSEPLKGCQGQIERFQFKKRYAMVRHKLWGEEQVLVLGILLQEDENWIDWADNAFVPVKEMA